MKLALAFLFALVLLTQAAQFDSDARDYMLYLHNRARGRVDPVAHASWPIPDLVWSDAAASFASDWADKCVVQHSQGSGFGENIYQVMPIQTQTVAADGAVGFFEGEKVGFSFSSDGTKPVCDYTKTSTCGHYTQIVWRNTTGVGCGYANCGSGLTGYTFVVCNYDPPGNWLTPDVAEVPYFPYFYGSSAPAAVSSTPSPSPAASSSPSRSPSAASSSSPSPSPSRSPAAVSSSNVCSPACGTNYVCQNSICVCPSPYELDGSSCVLASLSGSGAYIDEFVVIGSSNAVTVPDDTLIVQAEGPQLLFWKRSADIMDPLTTRHNFNVKTNQGDFGLAVRMGQTSSNTDRVEMRWANIANDMAELNFCYWNSGSNACWNFGSVNFPASDSLRLKSTIMADNSGTTMITVTYGKDGSTWQFCGSVWSQYASVGGVGYYFDSEAGGMRPGITKLALATSTTVIVTLNSCIDDDSWNEIFYELMPGCDPATTKLTVLSQSGAQDCGTAKSAESGKELVSGLTFVITSLAVPSSALADSFVTAASSSTGAAAGVSSAGVISGTEGAVLAGSPVSTAGFAGPVATLGTGAAGGGGSAGLSGGAIAGIVIGSVAGGVLLLGVTALIVAAVVVGAVVLARGDDSSSDDSSAGQRRSVRQTIRGLFGGVNVMSNDPNGHQSLTARAPPMK